MSQSQTEISTETKSVELSQAELTRLVELYDLERYLFDHVSKRFQQERTLSDYDFFAIVIWKSNRAKTKIKRGLAAAAKSASELMREVNQAERPEDKVDVLLASEGLGMAMASAILPVCCSEQFTVLDCRAWDVLEKASVKGLPERYPQDVKEYVAYCEACQRDAAGVRLSLRDLDRALWARSWEDGLRDLIQETE
jgi:hypothetical protein